MGDLCAEARWHRKAFSSYATVARIRPRSPHVRYNLGATHEELGRTDEARRCYEKAIGLQPRCAGAVQRLALLLEERGDRGGAIAVLEAALVRRLSADKAGELLCERSCMLARAATFGEAMTPIRELLSRLPAHRRAGAARECIDDLRA